MDELIHERVFAIALGYSTQDDAGHLAHAPVLRAAVWNRSGAQVLEVRLVSQPTQPRLINIPPRGAGTLETLHDGLSECIKGHVHASGGKRVRRATIDSFPIKTQVKLMARHPTFTTEIRTTISSSPRNAWRPITIAPGRDIAWATA